MNEIKKGKPFWYVDKFRIKKYRIVNNEINHESIHIVFGQDDNGNFTWCEKDKICFTKEEALSILKENVNKLIRDIEND